MTGFKIPEQILGDTEKFFPKFTLQDALKFLKYSRVSISFSKGSPETFFICSGIIKDDRSHEAKIVYKKRLEGTDEGPLSSNCDCHKWSAESHCSHTGALFITYMLHLYHENHFDGVSDNMTHPPIPLESTFAVGAQEYGTIISAPHHLERAPTNATYSSLQYLLHTKKIINFPIPENFSGKLIIQITSQEHFNDSTGEFETLPICRFKYRNNEDKVTREISIFENLYLFNWITGQAFHLSSQLRDFIQKIRLYSARLKINDLIKLGQNLKEEGQLEIIIDEISLNDIPIVEPITQVHLSKAEKGKQISFQLFFVNEEGISLPPPEIITELTFQGGGLNSFRKKQNAYEFIEQLAESFDENLDLFKKSLLNSNQKSHLNSVIDYTLNESFGLVYHPAQKCLIKYDHDWVRKLITHMIKSFSSNFYRFSLYNQETQEVTFNIAPSTLYNGLSEFHTKVSQFGIQIFYDRSEIAKWSNKVRFERKITTTKWFDLELNINHLDLDIIKNADLDTGIAVTKHGMVLLDRDQKNLIKFLKKYTQYESKSNYEGSDPESEEEVNKFVLPFNRSRIFELFELKKMGIEGALTEEEVSLCERLSTLEKMPEYPLPNQVLEETLRPYQKTGYNWLKFLYENKLGACLADDMGLGKTLQTIAFIQSVYKEVDHILIVCPVTILLNWENEFKKFSDIDVHIYHGGQREINRDKKIILTSYGIMKREVDHLFSTIDFDIFILDEVQHLKNIRSQGAYAARKIKADFRICLTGTPVENDLAEFYNILDLSIPGIWGDLQFIRTSSTKKTRLLAKKTTRPFILRRTKAQVLTDLPPKTESNVMLSFSDEEKKEYTNSLVSIRKKIDSSPSKRKYGEILRGLLELRQGCLWQKKSKPLDYPIAGISSIKIKFLVEQLEQILEEGHQALIFSQFTTYLDYIQVVLREKHWKLARIDGSQSVKKRQEQVDVFQSGQAPVFLISLKAGGVGLNLTAASYVFIMDPWWNPAVERQAIDRAHRIGQTNVLTVYRPIIQGSVEEKVLELQNMKKELFNDLMADEDEGTFTGKLTMRDFEHLLSE
tara:strand:+ start:73577 stop:76765 length:3189 start_codon:yes stop_codon:yes gene_type:complete